MSCIHIATSDSCPIHDLEKPVFPSPFQVSSWRRHRASDGWQHGPNCGRSTRPSAEFAAPYIESHAKPRRMSASSLRCTHSHAHVLPQITRKATQTRPGRVFHTIIHITPNIGTPGFEFSSCFRHFVFALISKMPYTVLDQTLEKDTEEQFLCLKHAYHRVFVVSSSSDMCPLSRPASCQQQFSSA